MQKFLQIKEKFKTDGVSDEKCRVRFYSFWGGQFVSNGQRLPLFTREGKCEAVLFNTFMRDLEIRLDYASLSGEARSLFIGPDKSHEWPK